MRILRNPELKGILALIGIALVFAAVFFGLTGKLTEWFGIRLSFSKPLTNKIVFVSDRNGHPDIWVMNPDGSGQKPLTNDEYLDSEPIVSPDGYTVAFISKRDTSQNQLYAVDSDGSHLHRLSNITGVKSDPRFTADSKNIIFLCAGAVWKVPVDSESPDRLLPTHEQGLGVADGEGKTPYVWADESSDGSALVAVQSMEVAQSLVALKSGEEAPQPIAYQSPEGTIPLAAEMLCASFSNETKQLAVTLNGHTGSGVLMLVDLDSGSVNPVFQSGSLGSPDWSPDGSSIVMETLKRVAQEDYRPVGLTLVNPFAKRQRSFPIKGAVGPRWSPDGNRIVFVREGDIFSLDPVTGNQSNLTKGKGTNSVPAFSPISAK